MADLLVRANEICESLGNHIEETEKIGKIIKETYGEEVLKKTTIPVLNKGLKETKEKADKMPTEIERKNTEVSAEIAQLKETVQGFETQMTKMQIQLNNRQSNFLKMKGDLHAGQTAYDFENYLCTHIYPPGTMATHDQKFTTLMNWLEENKDTPEGCEGNRKWKRLTDKYGWTDETHKPVFLEMIRCRFSHAHPTVDFSLPIPENFNTNEKKYVEDIRKMTAELYELVHK